MLTKSNRNNLEIVAQGKNLPTIKEFFLMLLTFALTAFAWIFFRAESIEHAINYISEILSPSLFVRPQLDGMTDAIITLILVVLFVFIEWKGREGEFAIAHLGIKWKRPIRWSMYITIVFLIFVFGGTQQEFIYFQF